MPYSHKEDQNIVEYIVTHEYPSELYGNKIWKMMEHSNVRINKLQFTSFN